MKVYILVEHYNNHESYEDAWQYDRNLAVRPSIEGVKRALKAYLKAGGPIFKEDRKYIHLIEMKTKSGDIRTFKDSHGGEYNYRVEVFDLDGKVVSTGGRYLRIDGE